MEGRTGIDTLWSLLQRKVQEMEQRIEKLLREKEQLKSDAPVPAELQGEQVQMLARGELGACTCEPQCP